MKNSNYVLLAAVLGVIIGILATVIVEKGFGREGGISVNYQNWNKLNVILDEIGKNYVDTLDMRSMTDAAVTAALSELDPHSIYLPPVDLVASEVELAGNFEGIGIQFNVPNDTAVVLNVIQGGPSERVGILTGDKLIRVDGRDIAGVKMAQDSMVAKMRGPSGSKVEVTVLREGVEIPFEITRDKIPVNSVEAAFMLDGTTGYLRLSKFSRSTFVEFHRAALELREEGMERLIVDLRDNSGGYMDQALLICNEFLDKGDMIVYMEGLHRRKQEYKADGTGTLQDIGLTVLINESSASASEIVAGAIQDNDRGVIVGRRSYGKGLVQEPINFTDGSGLRLTVARYYTPAGRCIQKPYDDYQYDLVERYRHSEMTNADSVAVDRSVEYFTVGGRVVYGGGGIVPDIFVPVDTTRATNFYVACNRKTLQMRFAASVFDKESRRISALDSYEGLEAYFAGFDFKGRFLAFAAENGVVPAAGEWKESEPYLVPQLRALIARYSKLGEEAFYKFYIDIDDGIKMAWGSSSDVSDITRTVN
ncbi:MAG: S41 family peptidase [Bacteroidales bacterium]|nr:S41 family peptidase [Bacteroidales bacterium]